jgi:hypothetical protein
LRTVKPACLVFAIVMVACVQAPPHATLVIEPSQTPVGHAVLVLPTACVAGPSDPTLCRPATFANAEEGQRFGRVVPESFGAYIDPALRLKLELAGFTLAEAGALRLQTADRLEVNKDVQVIEPPGPKTVAELGIEDIRAVATSLALTSLLMPTLTIERRSLAEVIGVLRVPLVDVATMRPRWTVTCRETLFDAEQTTNRLANCAGNGVLAVLAPDNVIGKAL